MFGISSSGKENIGKAVEEMFDSLAYQLLGDIPRMKNRKNLFFAARPNLNLAHIFIQAMNNRAPNHIERDVLKSMLDSAHGYIESLKNKTRSNVTEGIDSLVKDAKSKGESVSSEDVQGVFRKEMDKARNHMKTIAEAETTKTRNIGHTVDITKVAADLGDSDPTVFFVIVRDGVTCKECLRLHMMPDGITPRLWKLSETTSGYHVRGEDRPSTCGEHPACRCSMTYLARGFGFKNGYVSFVGQNYDGYAAQRS